MPALIGRIGLIDAAEFLGAGMDMDRGWLRHGNVEQRIAAGGHLAHARADDEQQIGLRDALRQLRIDADADVAGIVGMQIVDDVLAAERAADRKAVGLGEAVMSARPAALQPPPPTIISGRLAAASSVAQPRHIGRRRDGPRSVL